MPAIETRYREHVYRSRLEARWAVAFHEAGIAYEYEKQGYDLRGKPYLPDFWLTEAHWWVEIKPGPPDARERRLAQFLAIETGCDTFVFCGAPANPEDGGFAVWEFPAIGSPVANTRGQLILSGLADLLAALRLRIVLTADTPEQTEQARMLRWKLMGDFHHGLSMGRSARFEHGQRGAIRQWATSIP